MKFTDNDLEILKNFSNIQPNILLKPGKSQKTISTDLVIFGKADLDSEIPHELGIYDLPEFLSVLNLIENYQLKFNESHVQIVDDSGITKVKYFYSDKDVLDSPKKDSVVIPSEDVKFKLDTNLLGKIKKASSVLGYDILSIKNTNNNGILRLEVINPENEATSNSYSIDAPGEYQSNADFDFRLNINNFKILPYTYEVVLCERGVAYLKSENNIEYYMALDKNSQYNIKES